ncbi:MAG: MBL fold metallo-hydrolase [Planctomycetales bacterium]|nr:MBL fold metallo-hydrolase [Planctomycetales bacterium]
MELVHHGGHEGVTGSCHELRLDNGRSLLVDCGLFQGEDARRHPKLEIEFDVAPIAAMLLTHVHIDHVGRLPYLLAAGYKGPIYCSHPTAELLPVVLADAVKMGFTRNQRMIDAFVEHVGQLVRPLPYGTWTEIEAGAKVRPQPAGHILGSAFFELDVEGRRVVFSGDVGADHSPLLKDPLSPERADLLVLESTYGDKLHEGRETRRDRLEQVLRRTLEDKGVTIIPAFSLGRTQELLYEMNGIFERIQASGGPQIMKAVDVIVDSPAATRYTDIYQQLQPYWDEEAQQLLKIDDQPLVFENLTTIDSHQEHLNTLDYLHQHKLPAIVIAGSGMCTGGRVMNYLERLLGDETTDVLFVGYQSAGTLGRALQSGAKSVKLDGRQVEVRAKVHSLSGYSAHADQQNLLDFVGGMATPPDEIVLVHGESDAKRALRGKLEQRGLQVR